MKKTVTFIKDHPAGIKAGRTCTFTAATADRHIEAGYATEEVAEAVDVNPETIEKKVTKAYLKEHPELEASGVKVGDTINIENPDFVKKEKEEDIQL